MRIEILANRNKSQNVRGPIFNSRGAGLIGDLIPGAPPLTLLLVAGHMGDRRMGSFILGNEMLLPLFTISGRNCQGRFLLGRCDFHAPRRRDQPKVGHIGDVSGWRGTRKRLVNLVKNGANGKFWETPIKTFGEGRLILPWYSFPFGPGALR